MSGHSKWANIKHRKAKGDSAKAKIFTKIGREIAVAVKAGGQDPNSNSKLKDIIAKAKAANIPGDNIARSIKKAAGELGSINYESIVYEGYGPGGVAVIVESLTDNKNRTAGDVRHGFDKHGGSMGVLGCVSFMFDTKGVLTVEKSKGDDEDEMMMTALDNGADDFDSDGDSYTILCSSENLTKVTEAFEFAKKTILSSEVTKIPNNTVDIDGENLENFLKMIDRLDDLDDVQNVYHNANLPETDEDE